MGISKGSAHWSGGFKDGRGTMHPAHGADVSFGAGSRFEGQPGSNPEEMIGAALSGCFSMALSVGLGKAGLTATAIRTNADVHLERVGDGFSITTIELTCEAAIPGANAEAFAAIAEETKKSCPVSKALAGVKISLKATLEG